MEALEKSRRFWDVQTMEEFGAQFYFSIAATSFLHFYSSIANFFLSILFGILL